MRLAGGVGVGWTWVVRGIDNESSGEPPANLLVGGGQCGSDTCTPYSGSYFQSRQHTIVC